MKKVTLMAASLAMVATAAPAMAQDDNSVNDSFNSETNTQYQTQDCSVVVNQYNNAVAGDATASGDAAIAAVAAEINAPVDVVQNCVLAGGDATGVVGGDVAGGEVAGGGVAAGGEVAGGEEGAAASGAAASGGESASASYSVLPDTGGASLIALGAGALLVAGGLVARRIVR